MLSALARKASSLAQKPIFPSPKPRAAPVDPSVLASQAAALSPLASFPLGRYLSFISVFSLLLIFTLIGLPQSQFPFPLSAPRQKTSLDRPEWAWVSVLTRDPLATSVWVVAGSAVVCAWWASQLGKMWEEEESRKKGGKEGVEREKEEDEVMRLTQGTSKAVQVSSHPLALHVFVPIPCASNADSSCASQTIKAASVTTLISSAILHFLLLLLGAPLRASLQTQAETYALALVLSILTVFTPVWVLGYPPMWPSKGGKETWFWNRLFIEVESVRLAYLFSAFPP